MSRPWWLCVPAVLLLAVGCTPPAAPPVLQAGDAVRPEISFAPLEPLPVGRKVSIGMLLRVERPGVEPYYLQDQEVDTDRAVMACRVTFLNGETVLGDPLEVPFVRDC